MSRITSKGQVTIPQEIRKQFALLPGMDVEVIAEGNQVLIIKNNKKNKFKNWFGRGEHRNKQELDLKIDQLRGRFNE